MNECANLRLKNKLLSMELERMARELAKERAENEYLRGVIGEAIGKLEELERKRKLIIEIEV